VAQTARRYADLYRGARRAATPLATTGETR